MISEIDFKNFQKVKYNYIVTYSEMEYYIYDMFELSYGDKRINYILNFKYKKNYENHLIKKVKIINNGVSYQYYDCGVIVCETNCIEYAALRFCERQYKR